MEFQSNETLLLDTEIKDQSEILLLNNEILEKDKEINEKEIQNILVASENQDKIDGLDSYICIAKVSKLNGLKIIEKRRKKLFKYSGKNRAA